MSQSTELTGGAGFVYESHVAAYFMSALLAETVRPPLQSQIKSVRLQQAALGAPLDDIIIELDTPVTMKAHFQVKRSLTISSAKTNKDFKEIVKNSWKTYIASKKDACNDIYGALTDEVATHSLRNVQTVCETARSSENCEAFWALEAGASEKFKEFIEVLRRILGEAQIQATPLDLYDFLKGFYIESLRIMIPGSPLATAAINELKTVLQAEHRATDLWESLKGIAREGAGQAATYNKRSLQQKLILFSLKDEPIQQSAQMRTGQPGAGVVQANAMNCALAFSHVSIEHSDFALTALIVTDEPERLSGQISSWKERIARSALIPDENRTDIAQQALKNILTQPILANILLQDLAVADFSAYIYYAKKTEIKEWDNSKYELELKTLPLFHRLSNKREFIGEIYTAEIDANRFSEAATRLVAENYHREIKAPILKQHAGKTSVILELADAIAQIAANFIAGDQIAASQIGYIKTRIRYGENVVTREKHLRDRNPLA
ncbi:hypothetical protein [Pseudomonas aeruginosa]|uniref:hypothetical protein n=1 Tax=Pseudomonas aeruginosa TaxID=287 RepID=UPI000FC42956|nr:hypothetical protein [Pseudomonas aeruginosa]RUI17003.1 hypothetical protein IPC443_27400 [Pseudomonas aeruginosa]